MNRNKEHCENCFYYRWWGEKKMCACVQSVQYCEFTGPWQRCKHWRKATATTDGGG